MLKNKKLSASVVLSTALCLIVSASLLLGSQSLLNASTVSANATTENSSIPLNDIVATITDSNPERPVYAYEKFNTAVGFYWYAGYGATEIVINSHDVEDSRYSHTGSTSYKEYYFPDSLTGGYTVCSPYIMYAKSYNANTGLYSHSTTSIRDEVRPNGSHVLTANRDCLYPVVNGLIRHSTTETVPTSFDKDGYIWHHNAKKGDVIRGTVLYGGKISNIEVVIPGALAKNTDSVILNGLTIYLRTGPNRCSIKVDNKNINNNDLKFAFGVEHK